MSSKVFFWWYAALVGIFVACAFSNQEWLAWLYFGWVIGFLLLLTAIPDKKPGAKR